MPPKKRPFTPAFFASEIWEIGSIVWVKWGNKWWSGIILKREDHEDRAKVKNYLIFWFGDHRVSEVNIFVICIRLLYYIKRFTGGC